MERSGENAINKAIERDDGSGYVLIWMIQNYTSESDSDSDEGVVLYDYLSTKKRITELHTIEKK